MDPSSEVRLQKFLASAGIGSRRHCEEYIRDGRVTVNGQAVRELGTKIDPQTSKVFLDGELIKAEVKRYYLLNKPAGYLCTNRDPAGRPRAIDLVPQDGPRLFTVGRLDEGSQGLLLVTNDGEMANRLAHPRYRIERQYRVQVVGSPNQETLRSLKQGLFFAEGRFRVRGIRKVGTKGKSTFLELTLTEGQNREIRRVLARVGHKVIQLQRISFGPLKLGRLVEGCCRPLRPAELKSLRNLMEPTAPPKPHRRTRREKK